MHPTNAASRSGVSRIRPARPASRLDWTGLLCGRRYDAMPSEMKPRSSKRRLLAAVFLASVALLAAAVGAVTTLTAFHAALFPYNGEGRYFDGVAVHHDGAQFVYGAMALVAWTFAGGAAWAAYRFARCATSTRQGLPGGRT